MEIVNVVIIFTSITGVLYPILVLYFIMIHIHILYKLTLHMYLVMVVIHMKIDMEEIYIKMQHICQHTQLYYSNQ